MAASKPLVGLVCVLWLTGCIKQEPVIGEHQSTAMGGKAEINIGLIINQNPQGIPPALMVDIAKQLGVSDAALLNFFQIMGKRDVTSQDYDKTLREFAAQFKQLQSDLESYKSDDPEVDTLRREAKQALDEGDFERAEARLKDASAKDIESAKLMEQVAVRRLKSAAATESQIGDLKLTQLAHADAAMHYEQAVALLPEGEEWLRADYYTKMGLAWVDAGFDHRAEVPLRKALDIRMVFVDDATLTDNYMKSLNYYIRGRDFLALANSYTNLGLNYSKQSIRPNEAELYLKKALDIRKKLLDEHHPLVAQSLINIGLRYSCDKSMPLYEEAMVIQRYYAQNLDLAGTLVNVANCHLRGQQFTLADNGYAQALAIFRKHYGDLNLLVTTVLMNQAKSLKGQARYDEAEAKYNEIGEIHKKMHLAEEHPQVYKMLLGLAHVYSDQGRCDEAEKLVDRVLKTHPVVIVPDCKR